MANFSIENDLAAIGYKLIAGIDEAGRGPLAGPVVAAAVILPIDAITFEEVNDSKKLTEKKRLALNDIIIEKSLSYSIEMIDNLVIDKVNILNATLLAMKNATRNMKLKPDFLLIDGNRYDDNWIPYKTIIKGDNISKSIAAASILAKVYRDKWMTEVAAKEFPQYNFEKHKGYGTKEHFELIKKYGTCKYHRNWKICHIINSCIQPNSILKEYFNPQNKLF